MGSRAKVHKFHASAVRSAKLDAYLRDETSSDYVLRALSLFIDLRAP
jgi:hypothetical protein